MSGLEEGLKSIGGLSMSRSPAETIKAAYMEGRIRHNFREGYWNGYYLKSEWWINDCFGINDHRFAKESGDPDRWLELRAKAYSRMYVKEGGWDGMVFLTAKESKQRGDRDPHGKPRGLTIYYQKLHPERFVNKR